MFINSIIQHLESFAPLFLQEDYDNAGLIIGNGSDICTGALISLDCTEAIVQEAMNNNCNLIISHHPIVFKGLKKINGRTYVERTIIKAIKNDIAVYAIHTNLDNTIVGVNGKIAAMLGLKNVRILSPKKDLLQKLTACAPLAYYDTLLNALFAAGAGDIGNYSECSFKSIGVGTFTPGKKANPFIGKIDHRETVQEIKLEVVFPSWLQNDIINSLKANHPYEEVAYDIYNLENTYDQTGSGIVGELSTALTETQLLMHVANVFKLKQIKHTALPGKMCHKIAVCGGAGSFLLPNAIAAGADAFITADIKYHEYFDADEKLLLLDIGHYESEQYTVDLLFELLSNKFPNFALLKTGVNTNPVQYFVP
jgi:dinuclear metal center YbgI/SA1388 family protein